jgi:hypothetical protein
MSVLLWISVEQTFLSVPFLSEGETGNSSRKLAKEHQAEAISPAMTSETRSTA